MTHVPNVSNICDMSKGMDLKVRRIRAKVTQKQVAASVGLSRSWVARVERDDFEDSDAYERYEQALRTFEDVRRVA